MRKALMLTIVFTGALAAALWRTNVSESFAAAERARLRVHFDSAERELRAGVVPGLRPDRRAARARLLDILRAYRLRGIFPRNTDFAQDTSVFIDYWGTRCGVAYLMEQTGNEDMVLRIAATRNNARVPELQDDPEVGRWLAANGITLAEATRIQPTYGCGTIHPDKGTPCPAASAGYKVATGAIVAGSATAFTLSVLHDVSTEAGGVAAVGTGLVGIMAGLPNIGESGSRGTLGVLNAGVGAASLVFGFTRLMGNTHTETQSRVSLAPWVGARARTGLVASLKL